MKSIGKKRTAYASSGRILMRCMVCFHWSVWHVVSTHNSCITLGGENFCNSYETHSFLQEWKYRRKPVLHGEINSQCGCSSAWEAQGLASVPLYYLVWYIKHTSFADQLFDQFGNYISFRYISTPERTQTIARFFDASIGGPLYFLFIRHPNKKRWKDVSRINEKIESFGNERNCAKDALQGANDSAYVQCLNSNKVVFFLILKATYPIWEFQQLNSAPSKSYVSLPSPSPSSPSSSIPRHVGASTTSKGSEQIR